MGNLSTLLSDAFTIYSESYVKIGQLGVKVVDLENSPAQPKKTDQLIACTRLYRIIGESIILNDAGTAIKWIVGDVAIINNLLLKLKLCCGLYSLPAFPTPLTEFVFNFGTGSGGATTSATYITVDQEVDLTQSRRLILGGDGILSLTDGGALGNLSLVANLLDIAAIDTSVNPMVINMNSYKERLFKGNANITTTRTWSVSNTTNARRFQFLFTISGLTSGGSTHDQTMPSEFSMSDARWTTSTKKWRPIDNGVYQAIGTTYDGVNWTLVISEAFT